MHVLLVDVGLPGFPAEAADHGLALGVVPDPVGTAAMPSRLRSSGSSLARMSASANGFEQAQADHRRGDARRKRVSGCITP
jgi:hypothetical protein